jgi:hypothetical protein
MNCMIEFPNALEPGVKRNLTHWELRTFNQIKRELHALRRRNLKWGCAQMLDEQPSQLARAQAHFPSQLFHAAFV